MSVSKATLSPHAKSVLADGKVRNSPKAVAAAKLTKTQEAARKQLETACKRMNEIVDRLQQLHDKPSWTPGLKQEQDKLYAEREPLGAKIRNLRDTHGLRSFEF